MFQTGAITRRQYDEGDRRPQSRPRPRQALPADPRAVLLHATSTTSSSRSTAARRCARAAFASTRRSTGSLQIAARKAIMDTLPYKDGSGLRGGLDPPEDRRDSRDGRGHAEADQEPVQPRLAGEAAGRLDVQDVRPCRGRRARRGSGRDLLHVGPFVYQANALSEPWPVKTYSESYIGTTSVARATLSSDNTVFAQLTLDLGPKPSRRSRARWASPFRRREVVPAMGLGSISVSPLEMASAYATLAAGGICSEPMAIRKVVLPGGKEDTRPAGASRSASASSPTGSRTR